MTTLKNRRNQMTDRAFLFNRNKKGEEPVLDKELLSKKIEQQTIAYVNSGGHIQKCTPFAYSDDEKETLGTTHRRTINNMSEKFYK
jgi:hypothetical protein|tara:strand:+ start:1338 stop:1595 length:258 start_codon:yes stop_codon:yes gene_type:complete